MYSLALILNKGLSEYQRKASRLHTVQPPPPTPAGGSGAGLPQQALKGAAPVSTPETGTLHLTEQAPSC